MANLLVRDVPPEVHEALARRAAAAGQSLQQYVLGELRRLAQVPTTSEMLERIGKRHGGRVGLAQAVEDLDSERP
ncbi:MAG: FitA-like ribbon-helix-helix domain-containing protein [Acidimicrobiales bacterium]